MNHGFFRVAAAVTAVNVADVEFNTNGIVDMARRAADAGARVVVMPELSVTAYTCGDLFHNRLLLTRAEEAIAKIARLTATLPLMVVVGAPVLAGVSLYNCAIAISGGRIRGIVPKTFIPNSNEFYERRWFMPAPKGMSAFDYAGQQNVPFGPDCLFEVDGVKIAIEICEDFWATIPPSSTLALAGAEVILNLSASDDLIGKYTYLRHIVAMQSARCIAAYIYTAAGFGESSTDLVFDGKAFIAENGVILSETERWVRRPSLIVNDIDIEVLRRDRMHNTTFGECAMRFAATPEVINCSVEPEFESTSSLKLLRTVNPAPFIPSPEKLDAACDEITNIQVAGLARRLKATGCKNLVVGISGGLDSTLALLVAVHAYDQLGLDRKGITGITMPGFGTTDRTYHNALTMMRSMGITIREIPIADAVNLHFRDIGHDPAVTDVTYENSQARERTQILMDVANQVGGMVLGTGDLSELALGWATYNGDHMSMYAVNSSIPKTLVRHLVRHFAKLTANEAERQALLDVIDTPISPELTPADNAGNIAQKTEDLVGPYELHDFFLYHLLRHGFSPAKIYFLAKLAFPERPEEELKHWLKTFFRRFFNQQFKRSCLPDGPKVGSVSISPRGDLRMPSDASAALWLAECDEL